MRFQRATGLLFERLALRRARGPLLRVRYQLVKCSGGEWMVVDWLPIDEVSRGKMTGPPPGAQCA